MTNYLQSLPLETLHIMLMDMEEIDIMSYCRTHKAAYAICEDNYFWIRKLNHDFQVLYKNTPIIPSEYVNRYPNPGETMHCVFQRWKNYDPYTSRDTDTDIIMFTIAQDKIPTDKEVVNIVWYAIRTQNLALLDFVYQKDYNIIHDNAQIDGKEIGFYDIFMDMSSMGGIAEPMLQWLVRHDYEIEYMVHDLITYGHLDLLKWLHEHLYYILNSGDLSNAIMSGQIEIINWIREIGVQYDVKCANTAAEIGNMYILKLLQSQGIMPDEYGFKQAAENYKINVIFWFYKQGITYSDTFNIMTRAQRETIDNAKIMILASWNLNI